MKWPTEQLGNLADFRNGVNFTKASFGRGVKVINVADFKDRMKPEYDDLGEINPGGVVGADDILQDEDIIFVRSNGNRALIGRTMLIDAPPTDVTYSAFCIRTRFTSPNANPRFYFYVFRTSLIRRVLSARGGGANIANLNQKILQQLEVPVPSSHEQDRIVDVLSSYDALIENNRRRIALLEEAAQQLYKEWFARLRFPGHEHTRITNGVPKGWTSTELGAVIGIKHGFAFKGKFFSDSATSRILLTPGNFKIGGGLKLDKLKYYSEDGPLDDAYVLEHNDLLLTMTDLSKTSDTLGYPLLVPPTTDRTFLHNQRLGLVQPLDVNQFPRFFLSQLFCDYRYRAFVLGSASGLSVKHTSPSRILAYKPLLPPFGSRLIQEFDQFAAQLNQQCQILIQSNEKLVEARDLLLPRLMSGEVEA